MSESPGEYAHINDLDMYYEVHGVGPPVILLHGALSAIGTSFGDLLPVLAQHYQVVAIEQQGHGRTADIGRPLSIRQMGDDTAALLRHLGIDQADFFGFSMGAAIALDLGLRRPALVRKLVLASVSFAPSGLHPELSAELEQATPEALANSPFEQEYLRLAPNPQDWPVLIEKNAQLDRNLPDLAPDVVASLAAPALLVVGDSDIVTPEHIVAMFRLLGGGVPGDLTGLPKSQLAILPGTTHVGIPERADLLGTIIPEFLNRPHQPE